MGRDALDVRGLNERKVEQLVEEFGVGGIADVLEMKVRKWTGDRTASKTKPILKCRCPINPFL